MLSRQLGRKVGEAGVAGFRAYSRVPITWNPLQPLRASGCVIASSPGSVDEWKQKHASFGGFSRGFATDALQEKPTFSDDTTFMIKNPTADIKYDEHNHARFPPGDPGKKAFTYFVLTGGRFIYASALRLLVLKFILSMSASKDVLALASLEVDLSNIPAGKTVTVKWRGKPVFIRHRTDADIAKANEVNLRELRDPELDEKRVLKPEWLVVIGVCTHLGCVPLPNAGDYGGWFCPCHGSHYDISGRVRKGPAPTNLEVPQYQFIEEKRLLVG